MGRPPIRIMKQTYIAPVMEKLNIDTVEMLAVSIRIDRNGQSGTQQLGNERGERQWGNIWNEGE